MGPLAEAAAAKLGSGSLAKIKWVGAGGRAGGLVGGVGRGVGRGVGGWVGGVGRCRWVGRWENGFLPNTWRGRNQRSKTETSIQIFRLRR